MDGEVVLVTGGSGFLGQHLVRELQERDPLVAEIRIVDLTPYVNKLGHAVKKPIISYVGDITNIDEIRNAFKGVSCVFHCAALVSYEYPPDFYKLFNINVTGTKNVIDICIEMDIPHLVFTSTAEVTLIPYLGSSFFSAIINQTEHKALAPEDASCLLLPGYATSKLEAERLVLQANGSCTSSGDKLRTISIRPTLIYGEEDSGFICTLMNLADSYEGQLIQVAGSGGKHQVCYAGNAAWGHICAKNALKSDTEKISGLPVFITDDSPVMDITEFCEHITESPDGEKHYQATWWTIPGIIAFILAFILEVFLGLVYSAGLQKRLPVSPKGFVSFMNSVILYNRLRAAVHLKYTPIYKYEIAKNSASKYYRQIFERQTLDCRQALQCKGTHT